MSLDRDNLTDHDLTKLEQAARQMAQDIANAATKAGNEAVRGILNAEANVWGLLARKVDEIIDGDV